VNGEDGDTTKLPPCHDHEVLDYATPPAREQPVVLAALFVAGLTVAALTIAALGVGLFSVGGYPLEPHSPVWLIPPIVFAVLLVLAVFGFWIYLGVRHRARWLVLGFLFGVAVISLVEGICFLNPFRSPGP
jgi:hypothetical protein